MSPTETKVRAILLEHLGIDADRLTPGAKLGADIGADSLDGTELALRLEDDLDISIPDGEIKPTSTLDDVVALVDRQIALKGHTVAGHG